VNKIENSPQQATGNLRPEGLFVPFLDSLANPAASCGAYEVLAQPACARFCGSTVFGLAENDLISIWRLCFGKSVNYSEGILIAAGI
jgi:hypothetical protein